MDILCLIIISENRGFFIKRASLAEKRGLENDSYQFLAKALKRFPSDNLFRLPEIEIIAHTNQSRSSLMT